MKGKAEIVRELVNTRNVVMVLPGEDPKLKDEYIIIGGHFDHLGMGGPGSGSRAIDTVGIHHGADDNASGTAGVMELALRFRSDAYRVAYALQIGDDIWVIHAFQKKSKTGIATPGVMWLSQIAGLVDSHRVYAVDLPGNVGFSVPTGSEP